MWRKVSYDMLLFIRNETILLTFKMENKPLKKGMLVSIGSLLLNRIVLGFEKGENRLDVTPMNLDPFVYNLF